MKVEDVFTVYNPAGLDGLTADTITTRLMVVPCRVTITSPGGAGVEWRADLKDYQVLLKVVGILAGLQIQPGDRVRVAAEGEGDAPRVAVGEIRRALTEGSPSEAPTLLRFRPPPISGKSTDHSTGEILAGASGFHGRLLDEDLFEIDTNGLGWDGLEVLKVCLRCAMPAFFLAGPLAGRGTGNEPLVHVEHFWPLPPSMRLAVARADRRTVDSARTWNRTPVAKKLVAGAYVRKADYDEAMLLEPEIPLRLTDMVQPLIGGNVDALAARLMAKWNAGV